MSFMSSEEIEKKTQEVWDTLNSKKFSQTDIFLGIYFELNPGIKNQELQDRKKW